MCVLEMEVEKNRKGTNISHRHKSGLRAQAQYSTAKLHKLETLQFKQLKIWMFLFYSGNASIHIHTIPQHQFSKKENARIENPTEVNTNSLALSVFFQQKKSRNVNFSISVHPCGTIHLASFHI